MKPQMLDPYTCSLFYDPKNYEMNRKENEERPAASKKPCWTSSPVSARGGEARRLLYKETVVSIGEDRRSRGMAV